MKKLIMILLPFLLQAQSGLHLNNAEYFTVSASFDPHASVKEHDLDTALEIEYVGVPYAKFGVEYFSGTTPKYFDWHGAFGINIFLGLFDKTRFYSGIRLGRIYRGEKVRGDLFGLESGVDFNLTEKTFIGLRATYDYRNDGVFLGWDDYWRASGFIRVGFKF